MQLGDYTITGDDARHLARSLRMMPGEAIALSNGNMADYIGEIAEILPHGDVRIKIADCVRCVAEPAIRITLYQGITKGDKMDLIVQKAVEVGVARVVPVLTARCVSRPDEKSTMKKIDRWRKIAKSAAEQSGRGVVPQIMNMITIKKAMENTQIGDDSIVFYERGEKSLHSCLAGIGDNLNIFIGPEGGFDYTEVEELVALGAKVATLGHRILRTETAGMAAISIIAYLRENGLF